MTRRPDRPAFTRLLRNCAYLYRNNRAAYLQLRQRVHELFAEAQRSARAAAEKEGGA